MLHSVEVNPSESKTTTAASTRVDQPGGNLGVEIKDKLHCITVRKPALNMHVTCKLINITKLIIVKRERKRMGERRYC